MEDKDKIVALKAENERLKEELATYGATGVCEVCSDKANKLADKYFGCLQEIKEIAEGIRNATYQFGQEADQKFFDETLGKILRKITKAEEE